MAAMLNVTAKNSSLLDGLTPGAWAVGIAAMVGVQSPYIAAQSMASNIDIQTTASDLDLQFQVNSSALDLNDDITFFQRINEGIRVLQDARVVISGGCSFRHSGQRYECQAVPTIDSGSGPVQQLSFGLDTAYSRTSGSSPGAAESSVSCSPIDLNVKAGDILGIKLIRAEGNTTAGTLTIEDTFITVRRYGK